MFALDTLTVRGGAGLPVSEGDGSGRGRNSPEDAAAAAAKCDAAANCCAAANCAAKGDPAAKCDAKKEVYNGLTYPIDAATGLSPNRGSAATPARWANLGSSGVRRSIPREAYGVMEIIGVFCWEGCDVTGLRRGVIATGLIGFGDETCGVAGWWSTLSSFDGPLMMESMLKLDIRWPLFGAASLGGEATLPGCMNGCGDPLPPLEDIPKAPSAPPLPALPRESVLSR